MKIALVSCVKAKQAVPCPAGELYTSQLFRAMRKWVTAPGKADGWFILSAKFGLVDPRAEIPPYEQSLLTATPKERAAWAKGVANMLLPMLRPGDEVVLLAGRAYRQYLAPHLELAGIRVTVPMASLGIGEQLGWLKRNS